MSEDEYSSAGDIQNQFPTLIGTIFSFGFGGLLIGIADLVLGISGSDRVIQLFAALYLLGLGVLGGVFTGAVLWASGRMIRSIPQRMPTTSVKQLRPRLMTLAIFVLLCIANTELFSGDGVSSRSGVQLMLIKGGFDDHAEKPERVLHEPRKARQVNGNKSLFIAKTEPECPQWATGSLMME